MKKLFISIAVVLVLALALVFPASASSPQPLVAVGEPAGTSSSIEVEFAPGMTLGQLSSVSWAIFSVEGYPAHLDITLDIEGDESMLTAEMAYNNAAGIELDEGLVPTYEEWLQTFELSPNDGYGEIDGSTMFWVTKMGAGNDDAPSGTLAQWKTGIVGIDPQTELSTTIISASTVITKLEIEVDNWVMDTVVYIDNILLNSQSTVGLSVITIPAPDIVAVSVDTNTLNFGTVYPGTSSATKTVGVMNVGTVAASVTTVVTGGTVFTECLVVTPDAFSLAIDATRAVSVQLIIPEAYLPKGAETGTLIFEATAQ